MRRGALAALALASLVSLVACGPKTGGKTPATNEAPAAGPAGEEQLYDEAMAAKDDKVRVAKLEQLYQRVQDDPEKKDFVAHLLVQAYAQAGDIDQMEKISSEITIEEDYQGASVQNAMAYAYAEKNLKLDRANSLILAALNELDSLENQGPPPQVDPDKFRAFIDENRGYFLDTLGWIEYRQGRNKESVAVLEEAARRVDHSTIRWHLGEAYLAAGDHASAAKNLAKAEAMASDDSDKAKAALDELAKTDKTIDVKALRVAAKAEVDAAAAKEKQESDARDQREKAQQDKANEDAKSEALEDRQEASVPKFALSDLEGHHLDNAALQKSVTVIDFWASWCGPCRLEMPIYETMFEKYKDKVHFVAVSVDDNKQDALDFMKGEGSKFKFPVAYDPDIARDFRVTGLPTLYVIGPCGNINFVHRGFNPQLQVTLPAQIDALIKEVGQSCDAKKPLPMKDPGGDDTEDE